MVTSKDQRFERGQDAERTMLLASSVLSHNSLDVAKQWPEMTSKKMWRKTEAQKNLSMWMHWMHVTLFQTIVHVVVFLVVGSHFLPTESTSCRRAADEGTKGVVIRRELLIASWHLRIEKKKKKKKTCSNIGGFVTSYTLPASWKSDVFCLLFFVVVFSATWNLIYSNLLT